MKEFFSKVVSFTRRMGVWGISILLLLGAIIYWLWTQKQTQKKVAVLKDKKMDVAMERNAAIIQATNATEKQVEVIRKKFAKKEAELDKEEERLIEVASKGPTEITKAWQEYLSGS